MWCSQCQQDVPAVAKPGEAVAVCCARCGQVPLSAEKGQQKDREPDLVAPSTGMYPESSRDDAGFAVGLEEPIDFVEVSDWDLDRQCDRVEQITRSLQVVVPRPSSEESTTGPNLYRFDAPPPDGIPAQHRHASRTGRRRSILHAALVWSAWSLGMMAFVCGAVVLAVAVVESRTELWSLGLPLALVGQALLLFGIILQLDRLSQADRTTQQTLEQLDDDLKRVRKATTLLGTTHSAPGQSFYLHLAQGAPPQTLLADLKGQLDLLAGQLGTESTARS